MDFLALGTLLISPNTGSLASAYTRHILDLRDIPTTLQNGMHNCMGSNSLPLPAVKRPNPRPALPVHRPRLQEQNFPSRPSTTRCSTSVTWTTAPWARTRAGFQALTSGARTLKVHFLPALKICGTPPHLQPYLPSRLLCPLLADHRLIIMVARWLMDSSILATAFSSP